MRLTFKDATHVSETRLATTTGRGGDSDGRPRGQQEPTEQILRASVCLTALSSCHGLRRVGHIGRRQLGRLPESVRRLTGGLASPASSSTPDARWSGGRVTGGSREAVWANTKRGDALSARNAENETMRCRSERNDALSVRS
jgi:hypothetical protein